VCYITVNFKVIVWVSYKIKCIIYEMNLFYYILMIIPRYMILFEILKQFVFHSFKQMVFNLNVNRHKYTIKIVETCIWLNPIGSIKTP